MNHTNCGQTEDPHRLPLFGPHTGKVPYEYWTDENVLFFLLHLDCAHAHNKRKIKYKTKIKAPGHS